MKKIHQSVVSALIILAFFAFWELASRLRLVDPAFVPPFTDVAANIVLLFQQKKLPQSIAISLFRAFFGLGVAVVIGVPLGFALSGAYRRVKIMLGSLTGILSNINPFVLLHVLFLFFGLSEAPKIIIIAWACLWPVTFNTAAGVESIDRTILKAGRAFGTGKAALVFKVMLPAASPEIFSGIRTSVLYSLFMLIAAEMMGADSGLGWMILNEQENFQMKAIFSIALVIALLGVAIDGLLVVVRKLCIPHDMREYMNSSGA
jgi:NitT/TauT family transport system permease protein